MINRKTTLICFPFAGGSAHAFQPLGPFFEQHFELIGVQLSGRGTRFKEPLLDDIRDIADDVWPQVIKYLRPPYAILGHSMGSLLAYITCHRIRRETLPPPEHLFLAGRQAPSIPVDLQKGKIHLLPKASFKATLQSFGGIHEKIYNDDEVFSFFEPILRADFKAVSSWTYHPQPLLDVSATILSGNEEQFSDKQIGDWQKEFVRPIQTISLPGGHFFLFEQAANFAAIIQNELT